MTVYVLDRPVVTGMPCQELDPELWFAESPNDVELAKELCRSCPLQRACLAEALDRREPWGVWGGELFLQGVVIPRKRPRGRPRKDAVQPMPAQQPQQHDRHNQLEQLEQHRESGAHVAA